MRSMSPKGHLVRSGMASLHSNRGISEAEHSAPGITVSLAQRPPDLMRIQGSGFRVTLNPIQELRITL